MIIFLKNIPSEAKRYEIASFINKSYNDRYLDYPRANVSLENVKILSIQAVESNTVEKHGLVRVTPKELGKKVIERLDGTTFKGKCIAIREYINRSVHNDPRNKLPADTTKDFKDRRISDRRRKPVVNSWQNDPILVHA